MKKYYIEDEELGRIIFQIHATARRFVFRSKADGLEVTVPRFATRKEMLEVIGHNRERLKALLNKSQTVKLKEGDVIETRTFRIAISCGLSPSVSFRLQGGVLDICCPKGTDFASRQVQLILTKGIIRFIRQAAEEYLPARLAVLAQERDLTYSGASVSFGRKRLGKCDSRKHITLSYYLMFLPPSISDYVICHELAHLREMNHGAAFHKLCDDYCGGKEKQLEKALKAFHFPVE